MKERITVAGVVLIALSLGIQAVAWSQAATPGVVGHWQSKEVEDLGNDTFGWREFTVDEREWEVVFTMYFDKEKTMPAFAFRGRGPYEILGKSEKTGGAHDAVFRFSSKYVTLMTDSEEAIGNLGFGACGLETGREKDISEAGCSFLVSVDNCAQEYDVVKIDGNALYLGARPADGNMCTEDLRPVALGYPLTRK